MKSAVVLSLLSAGGVLALPATSGDNAVVRSTSTSSHVSSGPLTKVPMGKKHAVTRSNGKANIPGFFASLNSTLIKYGKTPLPYYAPVAEAQEAAISERRAVREAKRHAAAAKKRQANEALVDQYEGDSEDAAYYGPVVVGADDGHAQTFELIFDTGSSDIWYVFFCFFVLLPVSLHQSRETESSRAR